MRDETGYLDGLQALRKAGVPLAHMCIEGGPHEKLVTARSFLSVQFQRGYGDRL